MRIATATLAVGVAVGFSAGCDFRQLTAKKLMAGTLLAVPTVQVDPVAVAGLDAGTVSADGGTSIDIPGSTAAFVFFGTRTSDNLDDAPEPISDATVSLRPAGAAVVALNNTGSGTYAKSSVDDPRMTYESGKLYQVQADHGGAAFIGEVEAPALEVITQLHPPQGFVEQDANTALSFTRAPPPSGQERRLGFVTVFPLDSEGKKGTPTYTSAPQDAVAMVKLVAFSAEWRSATVTVPGTAFPQPGTSYLVVFQSAQSGGPKSSNLFTGSVLLAGTSDVGVVRTR